MTQFSLSTNFNSMEKLWGSLNCKIYADHNQFSSTNKLQVAFVRERRNPKPNLKTYSFYERQNIRDYKEKQRPTSY